MRRRFMQVDVFADEPYFGNPVAVVLDASGMSDDDMQAVARWTNLSETTFVLHPVNPAASYRVRIFTPAAELPFAGHPTLGTCHAWLSTGHASEEKPVLQECAAGLVELGRDRSGHLQFAAPPLLRTGPVEEATVANICRQLRLERADVVEAQWVDNGPGWAAVLLRDADAVLALRPGALDMPLGAVGPYPPGSACAFEVRAFFSSGGETFEDPVTGSLNASLAQWFFGTGKANGQYVVSQGTVLGRRGRAHLSQDGDGRVWVGGNTLTCIDGFIEV